MIQSEKVRYSINENTDLFGLLKSVWLFCLGAYKYIIVSAIIGLIIGFLHFKLTPPVYKSTLIAESNLLTDRKIETLVTELEKIISQQDYEQASQLLGMSVDEVKKIKEIDITLGAILNKKKVEEEGVPGNVFGINVVVYDQAILKRLEDGIIRYISKNSYVSLRMDVYRNGLQNTLDQINHEIKYLESLKQPINNMISTNSGQATFTTDMGNMSTKIVELQEKRYVITDKLALAKTDTFIIKNFTTFKEPSNPKLPLSLSLGLTFALTVGLVAYATRAFVKR